MALTPTLYQRIEHEITRLEQRIQALGIREEDFAEWFDSQLFNQDASSPLDYVHELRSQLHSLQGVSTAARSEWLSERIAHQLNALHQAVRWYEQRR